MILSLAAISGVTLAVIGWWRAWRNSRVLQRARLVIGVHDALEMASDEAAVCVTVGEAFDRLGEVPVELLLGDASGAHAHRAGVSRALRAAAGCDVAALGDCPAVRRGHALTTADSTAIDACPHVRGRAGGPWAATCVPVASAAGIIGVLHAPTSVGARPDVETMERVARHTGARLAVLRSLATSELHAATDPLTGLLNRRSLLARVASGGPVGTTYAVAIADLDHFKRLNDRFGHETGDRALKVFAAALTDAVRDIDLVCRHGGEEFVVVFPSTTQAHAAVALERVRAYLRSAVAAASLPRVTASFGVAESTMANDFDGVLRLADRALLNAKRDGRDRVECAERPGRNGEVLRPANPAMPASSVSSGRWEATPGEQLQSA